jgi:non-heme chloroperoxidase
MLPAFTHAKAVSLAFIVMTCQLLPANASAATDDGVDLQVLKANCVELHYIDSGSGIPVIFVHGGLADYREFAPVATALPKKYRTVLYSRRHNFPNDNEGPGAAAHMTLEIADLAGLSQTLDLGPAHIVGTSYGGFIALMLAMERPDLVRSVTAAEPPLLHWLPGIDGGQGIYDDFETRVLAPSRAAFSADRPEEALRVAMDYFIGPSGLDLLPQEVQDMLLSNIRDWQGITSAPDALPQVTREEIAAIEAPVLLLSGAASTSMHKLIDRELFVTLTDAERTIIEEGTHEMCVEKPAHCARAIEAFIKGR